MKKLMVALVVMGFISGCAPKVGSTRWCEKLEDKPNGEWTINEAKDYARHCLFKSGE